MAVSRKHRLCPDSLAHRPRPLQDIEAKKAELRAAIAKETKFLAGFQSMKSATVNVDVQKSCDAKIKESTRTIGFFEASLRELEARSSGGSSRSSLLPSSSSNTSVTSFNSDPRRSSADPRRTLPQPPGPPSWQPGSHPNYPPPDGPAPSGDPRFGQDVTNRAVPPPKPNLSNLGASSVRF